jgi:hypothetical protein
MLAARRRQSRTQAHPCAGLFLFRRGHSNDAQGMPITRS